MLIHTLKKALAQGRVPLTRHRIDLISRLMGALIQVRSVNMGKLACSLLGMALSPPPALFQQRGPPAVFTLLLVSTLVRPGQPQVLVLDRTH